MNKIKQLLLRLSAAEQCAQYGCNVMLTPGRGGVTHLMPGKQKVLYYCKDHRPKYDLTLSDWGDDPQFFFANPVSRLGLDQVDCEGNIINNHE